MIAYEYANVIGAVIAIICILFVVLIAFNKTSLLYCGRHIKKALLQWIPAELTVEYRF